MISIEKQEFILTRIGDTLEKKLYIYAIGGTAMMLKAMKDSTLDIDFVFDKSTDRKIFISTLKKLGAKESDVTLVYGLSDNTPDMLMFEDCRFDLFLNKIISSKFSDKMKNRAEEIHEFGKNLIIKVADLHDIIILKSATSRDKDLDDIIAIADKTKINWNIIVEEAKVQIALGNQRAIVSLGEKLEKLNNQKLIDVPITVLDELWNILRNQIDEKAKKSRKQSK